MVFHEVVSSILAADSWLIQDVSTVSFRHSQLIGTIPTGSRRRQLAGYVIDLVNQIVNIAGTGRMKGLDVECSAIPAPGQYIFEPFCTSSFSSAALAYEL